MRFNVYSLTTAAPSHLAGFNSHEAANEWADGIRKQYKDTVPILVTDGTISTVKWGNKS